MDQKKLSLGNTIFVGSMLFGLFFGAGNLIFPVEMGQKAGANTPVANLGFLLTAVGLPFLAILAMGVTNSDGVRTLASKVDKRYANVFTILLYATIGPFFAIPRLAAVSYTFGIQSFFDSVVAKVLYSALFFGVAYLFARKPSRILEIVGKWLNPAFLLFLGILLVIAFIHPLGSIGGGDVAKDYQSVPFIQGAQGGYNTMDVLAGLAFGIIVISTLKNLGARTPKEIAKGTFKSGIVVVILMAVIYTAVSFMGAMSLGGFKAEDNGGVALQKISSYYLGSYGAILLAAIVVLVTLKTAVGLFVAIGEATVEFSNKTSYLTVISIMAVLSGVISVLGLDQILAWSRPVLFFLYPLSITLLLLALFEPLMGYRRPVYVWTTVFAGFVGIFDALNQTPGVLKNTGIVQGLLKVAGQVFPLFSFGIGWLVPSLIGFAIGFVISVVKKNNTPSLVKK